MDLTIEEQAPAELTLEECERQMEVTRAGLRKKVDELERVVGDWLTDATVRVAKTTQTVKALADQAEEMAEAAPGAIKSAAGSGLDAARRMLDVRGHLRRSPWLTLGGAVALGFLCGYLCRR